eukprot:3501995-Alexandrium_andersonii.AAC.1
MSASLVGSEMCIRDRVNFWVSGLSSAQAETKQQPTQSRVLTALLAVEAPVSYTHLTLPTICSV